MIHDVPAYQRFLLGINLVLSATTNASPSTAKGLLIAVTDATGGSHPDPVISGHVDKYLRVAGVQDQNGVAVKVMVEGLRYPVYCVRSANKWTVCKKITTKAASVTTKINPEPGDRVHIVGLEEALIQRGCDQEEAKAIGEGYSGKVEDVIEVYLNGKEYWVTVAALCDIPLVCCQLLLPEDFVQEI